MNLQLVGINHKTSSVSQREKFIINETNQVALNRYLKDTFGERLSSSFGLSTCNRTELYLYSDIEDHIEILNSVKGFLGCDEIDNEYFYSFEGEDALIHIARVASGIDSQVLGEQEIFGQFKMSISAARDQSLIPKPMNYYIKKSIEIVKKVRTETRIGLNPLSVSGLSVNLIKNIFEDPKSLNVLIIGAGSLGKSVIENLYQKGITKISAVNRSSKEITINENFSIVSSSLQRLEDEIKYADVVITSINTELPILGKGLIENTLKSRGAKPILLIDLGVPRNIESSISSIEQVYLYTIDDIEKITQDNYGERLIEAEKAGNIIVREASKAISSIENANQKSEVIDLLDPYLTKLDRKDLIKITNSNDIHRDLIEHLEDSNFRIEIITKLDEHILQSMVKRYIHDA
jgi:glutamyl-tRNA reductase